MQPPRRALRPRPARYVARLRAPPLRVLCSRTTDREGGAQPRGSSRRALEFVVEAAPASAPLAAPSRWVVVLQSENLRRVLGARPSRARSWRASAGAEEAAEHFRFGCPRPRYRRSGYDRGRLRTESPTTGHRMTGSHPQTQQPEPRKRDSRQTRGGGHCSGPPSWWTRCRGEGDLLRRWRSRPRRRTLSRKVGERR